MSAAFPNSRRRPRLTYFPPGQLAPSPRGRVRGPGTKGQVAETRLKARDEGPGSLDTPRGRPALIARGKGSSSAGVGAVRH